MNTTTKHILPAIMLLAIGCGPGTTDAVYREGASCDSEPEGTIEVRRNGDVLCCEPYGHTFPGNQSCTYLVDTDTRTSEQKREDCENNPYCGTSQPNDSAVFGRIIADDSPNILVGVLGAGLALAVAITLLIVATRELWRREP